MKALIQRGSDLSCIYYLYTFCASNWYEKNYVKKRVVYWCQSVVIFCFNWRNNSKVSLKITCSIVGELEHSGKTEAHKTHPTLSLMHEQFCPDLLNSSYADIPSNLPQWIRIYFEGTFFVKGSHTKLRLSSCFYFDNSQFNYVLKLCTKPEISRLFWF